MTDAEPRRFRLHWWGWVILGMLLVASFGLALHVHGTHRLESVQRDIAARGWPIDPVTLVATLPPVDDDRQNRLWAVLQRINTWSDPPRAWSWHELQAVTLTEDDHAEIDRFISAGAADMARLEAILDEGPVDISTGGWIERDSTRVAAMQMQDLWDLWETRTPNLLTIRAAIHWWVMRAVRNAADTRGALSRLEAFVAALDRPTILIDAMIAVAAWEIRDLLLLRLAARGLVDEATIIGWADEPVPHQRWLAGALAGERCLAYVYLYSMGLNFFYMDLPLLGTSRLVPNPFSRLEWAVNISSFANLESKLRAEPLFPALRMPFGLPTQVYLASFEEVRVYTDLAYTSSYRHRMRRLAGRLAHDHRQGRLLPDDQTAAIARLGADPWQARNADEPAITYERLSPTRFRIGLDPAHPAYPAPALHGLSSTTSSTRPPTSLGSPASAKAWEQHDWSLEIDLDAILVPPPPPGKRP